MRYASRTQVGTDKPLSEIKTTVLRYGAKDFAYGESGRAMVGFKVERPDGVTLAVRFALDLPDIEADEFSLTPERRRRRSDDERFRLWEQACRQRWRALALVIKAKLEAIETGISSFEQEFLAFVVTSNGRTIGDELIPKLERACKGNVPLLEGF